MNRKALQIALAIPFLSVAAAAQNLTPAEQQQALKLLNDSRNGVTEAVKGLSEAQWKFKPAPDRWSIAEVVEHLALIEDLVQQGVFPNLEKAPAGAADSGKQTDGALLTKLADRSTKYHAPEPAVPTGRWTPAEALEHFYAARVKTIAFLKANPDLRQHVIEHAVLGKLDGYQWVLAVAGHSARHTQQILEVKTDRNFPVTIASIPAPGANSAAK